VRSQTAAARNPAVRSQTAAARNPAVECSQTAAAHSPAVERSQTAVARNPAVKRRQTAAARNPAVERSRAAVRRRAAATRRPTAGRNPVHRPVAERPRRLAESLAAAPRPRLERRSDLLWPAAPPARLPPDPRPRARCREPAVSRRSSAARSQVRPGLGPRWTGR